MKNTEPPPFFLMMGEPGTTGLIPPFIGIANAGVSEMLDNAAWALTSGAKEMGKGIYGIGKAAAMAPFEFAKKVRTGTGTVVSYVDTKAGTTMDWAMNRYYGNSRQDEMDQIAETRARAEVAAMQGKMGAETMRTARDYLDSVEKGAGSAMEETVRGAFNMGGYVADKLTGGRIQNIWGRDTMSWGTGKIAELTTGMATGFGKGIMNLTNPDATASETLEGIIDTTFAFIGGSKAVVKGSQVLSGTKELGKDLAEKGIAVASREMSKFESAALKGTTDDLLRAAQGRIMTASEIGILCENTRKIMENTMRETLIRDTEKSIGKILRDLGRNAKEAVTGNLNDVPGGARDFVKGNLENATEALGATFGKTGAEYVGNVVGGVLDNTIKEGIKGFLLPDKEAADLEKMKADAARLAKLDPDDPKNKEAIDKITSVLVEKQKEMAKVAEKAEQAATEKTQAVVKERLLKEMEKEADKILSTPVVATGSSSGEYKGSVSMTLTPGGGPLNGTVTTKFGAASISGSVSKEGKISASVSGTMSYDWYADGVNATKKTCSLGGSMTGTVGNRRASGSYSTTCSGADSASGGWVVKW